MVVVVVGAVVVVVGLTVVVVGSSVVTVVTGLVLVVLGGCVVAEVVVPLVKVVEEGGNVEGGSVVTGALSVVLVVELVDDEVVVFVYT